MFDGRATEQETNAQRRVREEVHRIVSRHPDQLGSSRGDWVVVITRRHDRDAICALMHELGRAIHAVLPSTTLRWGVSAPCENPVNLPVAFQEAQTAVRAASRLGRDHPVIFDELGVVRVLFSEAGWPDLLPFVRETLGSLIDYDTQRDGALVETLRAYFEADCSQKEAAEAIPVHHKTLRYRLDKIEELTGLDFNRHTDRVRASIALELFRLAGPTEILPG